MDEMMLVFKKWYEIELQIHRFRDPCNIYISPYGIVKLAPENLHFRYVLEFISHFSIYHRSKYSVTNVLLVQRS